MAAMGPIRGIYGGPEPFSGSHEASWRSPCPLSSAASGLRPLKAAPTSYRRDDLVQELHAGSLPDLLDDGPQLLVRLLKVTWGRGQAGEALGHPGRANCT